MRIEISLYMPSCVAANVRKLKLCELFAAMSQVIPLIRSAAMVPFIRWIDQNRRPLDRLLDAADLAALPIGDPIQPIPIYSVATFLQQLAQLEGPDIGCKVVSSASVLELATVGQIALGSRTPREALIRVISALPFHCSHEIITLCRVNQTTVLRDTFSIPLGSDVMHIIHQFVASVIQELCAMTGAQAPILMDVKIIPHPKYGLEHLVPFLGKNISASPDRSLALTIDDTVMDHPFMVTARERQIKEPPTGWHPLRSDGSFEETARIVIAGMLADGAPTILRLAAASGMSVRTLQRRFDQCGTTFSNVLDDVRRSEALNELSARGPTVGEIATMLGYERQTSLTRAVRRWTGETPTGHRLRSEIT
ncbi:helix-turn-helix transcriptional regulator [Falsihalocynthiibacter sp. CO-5D18]|uniref:helix-turn-helix transcriptional regulator n=1 Tax=Falsihalocynthiibacter sp. CO-5D18 TaxID=3240872 RepID=UPI00350FB24D